MNRSHEFFDAIEAVWNTPVPDAVMARAKKSLLDYMAVTCAGAKFQEKKLENYFAFAQPESTKLSPALPLTCIVWYKCFPLSANGTIR